MHRTTTVLLLILAVLFLAVTGCGKGVPKGSSTEVKELVLQIAQDYYRDRLAAACYQQVSGIPLDIVGLDVDYDWLRNKAGSEEQAKATLRVVDKAMEQLNLTVENVRTEDVDEEVGKARCACDIRAGSTTDAISFTAQYNDDGRLYVEVFGLGDD